MNIKTKLVRFLCVGLASLLLICGLSSCATTSEVPDGYQYATCNGEYFRLFVPTQWTVNTESGISGAFVASSPRTTVTMAEVPFEAVEDTDVTPLLQFTEAHLAELAKLKEYKQEKSFDSTLSGYRAKDITYVAVITGESLRFRQILSQVAGRFYVFTYTSSTDTFDAHLDEVDEILENITFESFPFEGEDDRKIPDDVKAPDGMKLVSDNEVAYRFYAPEAWIRDVNNGQNLVYFSETDRSTVSMMGYEPEDATNYSVDTYWTECKDKYAATLENFTVISESETTLDGGAKKAKVYEYSYTLGGVQYKARQTVCVVGMIYAMTYTALPDNYDLHLEDVLKMEQAIHFRSFGE